MPQKTCDYFILTKTIAIPTTISTLHNIFHQSGEDAPRIAPDTNKMIPPAVTIFTVSLGAQAKSKLSHRFLAKQRR
jgi:hypothetical protein